MKNTTFRVGIVVIVLFFISVSIGIIGFGMRRQEEQREEAFKQNQEKYQSISVAKNQNISMESTFNDEGKQPAAHSKSNDEKLEINSNSRASTIESILGDRVGTDLLIAVYGTDERGTEKSRSDIIIVVKYVAKENKILMVSIPRDTRVEIPGRGLDKINHAFAFGEEVLAGETIENFLGIKLDHFVRINFGDFKYIIEEFGGVKVNAKKVFSNSSNSIVIPKGESTLNGEQGLFYVRYRSDGEGDYGRIERQQEVLKALINQTFKDDKIIATERITRIYNRHLHTDFDIESIVARIYSYERGGLNFESMTLKTTPKVINGIWYELYDDDALKEVQNTLEIVIE